MGDDLVPPGNYHGLRGHLTNFLLVVLIVLTLVDIAFGVDPLNNDLQSAAGDSINIAKRSGDAYHVRYLSLYAIPVEQRKEAAATCTFLLNHISYSGVGYQPTRISETLLRVDIRQLAPGNDEYAAWSKSWEDIAAVDPFYHGQQLRIKASDGEYYPVDSVVSRSPHIVATYKGKQYTNQGTTTDFKWFAYDAAPWLDLAAAKLLEQTTGSKGALLRADWFCARAFEPANYYAFTSSPATFAEWVKLHGVDGERGFGLVGVRGANLGRSGVTDKFRQLERRLTPTGAMWVTWDAQQQTADRDPFIYPNGTQNFDALEAFAMQPNGYWRFWISNAKGARQNEVPPQIALDDSYGRGRALLPPLSCISCHSRAFDEEATSGVLAFVDEQHELPAGSYDAKTTAAIAAYYGPQQRLQRDAQRDRVDYADAVKTSCGMTPGQAAGSLNLLIDRVTRDPLTAEAACVSLGIAGESLGEWLEGATDPNLRRLVSGKSIQFAQFENSFYEAASLISNRRRYAK